MLCYFLKVVSVFQRENVSKSDSTETAAKIHSLSRNEELCKNNLDDALNSDTLEEFVICSEVQMPCSIKKECDEVFDQKIFMGIDLKNFSESVDLKNNLTCPYCQKKFESVSLLDKHKDIHLGGWSYMCKICHKGFNFHHLLQSHISFHKTEVTFPCHTCGKVCVSRYKLKAHMKLHGDQYVCRICKQTFSTKECLKSHRSIHRKPTIKKEIFICKICSAKFQLSVELKNHLRMHASDWPFTCDVCKKLYRRRGSYLTHVSKCLGVNPYTCDICQKTFIRQCHFIEHVNQLHNGVRPFSCDTCHKRFNSKSNLEIHSQVHSTRLPTIYKCSLCQQMFNSLRKLKGHKIREHSLYRPYKCSTCKKIFIFKSQLTSHSKEHRVKEL